MKITTDAWVSYKSMIEMYFGSDAEYAQVVKNYSKKKKRFSTEPNPDFIKKRHIIGKMNEEDISTSLVERNNLTMRTFLRRLMRRTLAFSKQLVNLEAALAVYFAYYNYCWKHSTLGTSPAVEAGLAKQRFNFPQFYDHIQKNVLVPWDWDDPKGGQE